MMRAVALAAGVFAAALIAGCASLDRAPPRTLTVTGEGVAVAAPDQAQISAGLVTTGPTAAEALDANSRAMTQVFAALRDLGIAPDRIQTSAFSLQPQFAQQRPNDAEAAPRIVGYRASNQVTVRLQDVAKVGSIIDALVRSGANQLGGISFDLADPTAVVAKARSAAAADAQTKAQALAASLGTRLGPIQTVNEIGGAAPVPMMRMAAQADFATPIAAGEQSVHVTISVTYALN